MHRTILALLLVALVGAAVPGHHAAAEPPAPPPAAASEPEYLPDRFQDRIVFDGLQEPTAVAFSPDGRVFIAEKSGVIKVYGNLASTTPTVFADLSDEVHNYWDRGLLGLALAPDFPSSPYVYVAYAYDAPIGGVSPVWNDTCSDAPTTEGCVVSGRLSRLTASGNQMVPGSETVLINDWCQQFPSHSVGDLHFGPDGNLYMSGGEGAAFNDVLDYGELGDPPNPCGDPPGGAGNALSPPDAQGGALRSQSPRRPDGQARSLSGTVIRVNPNTGAGVAGNPFANSSDANARRIIAYGMRNPFRFTFRPGTNEIWLGDVDWYAYEELNYIPNATDSVAENFGWPCYQGPEDQPGFDSLGATSCEQLYESGDATFPVFTYVHTQEAVDGDGCGTNRSSITGATFYTANQYPARYRGGFFFGDYSRNCIWSMGAGPDGRPDLTTASLFMRGRQQADHDGGGPTDLVTGPAGDLFWVDYDNGQLHRVQYFAANQPPVAIASASPTFGAAPLEVHFDGSDSYDPDGDPVTYTWDLDGDGQFDDATSARPDFEYATAGPFSARLRVTDAQGLATTSSAIVISPGNSPPVPVIDVRSPSGGWSVGDVIRFSGTAVDPQDGNLTSDSLQWKLIIHHCGTPTICHQHHIQDFEGVSGSFHAPDHGYPSYLELFLTATDSDGLSATTSVILTPKTVSLTFTTKPAHLRLAIGGKSASTPFRKRLIAGSSLSISAITPQERDGVRFDFEEWSDGRAAAHTIVANFDRTLTATFAAPASTVFSLPEATRFRNVPVTWHHGAVATGFIVSEMSRVPKATDPRWRITAPKTFRLSPGEGQKVVHAWVRNKAGRITSLGVAHTTLDMTRPAASLAGPKATDARQIKVVARGTDEGTGVTGYFLSTQKERPALGTPGWMPTPPRGTTLAGADGRRTVHLWTRDAAGNVSRVANLTVFLDTVAPTTATQFPGASVYDSIDHIDGTTRDAAPSSGLRPVLYAIMRVGDCAWWDPRDTSVKPGECDEPQWFFVPGRGRWSGSFGAFDEPGTYRLYIQARDNAGNASNSWTNPTAVVQFRIRAPGESPPATLAMSEG